MPVTGIAGKIALVTGAANGIGAAVVEALIAEGARVAGLDIEPPSPGAAGPASRYEKVDVSRPEEVEAAVARIEAGWGPIDIGVNVAGILATTTILDTSEEAWRRVFDVNTHGVFNVSRALARHMVARRRGVIVTVGSNAAGIPRHSMAAYAASKAAATMFTRCLGLELAEFGIRCNIVAPGSTRTRMQEGFLKAPGAAERVIAGSLELHRTGIPLGKMAEPEDVANAVVFLASDQAGHITMTDIYVDGGATLRA